MDIFLIFIALGLALFALMSYTIVSFYPRLELNTLYQLPRLKLWTGLASLFCAWVAWRLNSGNWQAAAVGLCLVMVLLSRLVKITHILPPMNFPSHKPAGGAPIKASTEVLGLEVPLPSPEEKNISCVYPLEMIKPYALINDRVGGKALLVGWDETSRKGVAYAAAAGGQLLTFELNSIWRGKTILQDRQTGTLWVMDTGEALIGPLVGKCLEPWKAEQVRWEEWSSVHPDSLILQEPKRWTGIIPKPWGKAFLKMSLHL